MQTPVKVAVAGATGRVGRHVVDVLKGRGHDIVEISRSHGVDVITTAGLAEALIGVDCVVDASTARRSSRVADGLARSSASVSTGTDAMSARG